MSEQALRELIAKWRSQRWEDERMAHPLGPAGSCADELEAALAASEPEVSNCCPVCGADVGGTAFDTWLEHALAQPATAKPEQHPTDLGEDGYDSMSLAKGKETFDARAGKMDRDLCHLSIVSLWPTKDGLIEKEYPDRVIDRIMEIVDACTAGQAAAPAPMQLSEEPFSAQTAYDFVRLAMPAHIELPMLELAWGPVAEKLNALLRSQPAETKEVT